MASEKLPKCFSTNFRISYKQTNGYSSTKKKKMATVQPTFAAAGEVRKHKQNTYISFKMISLESTRGCLNSKGK